MQYLTDPGPYMAAAVFIFVLGLLSGAGIVAICWYASREQLLGRQAANARAEAAKTSLMEEATRVLRARDAEKIN
jgi:hypothetical protein